ncbi:MAG: sugar phosphate isomerase/epimerase [Phycisphaerales bacterium]|nr:sugar phosphate isomerase/epimerase [Phycisphaerales bacterium]
MKRTLATTAPFGFDADPVRFMKAYAQAGATTAQFYRNPEKPDCVTVVDALAASEAAGTPYDAIHGLFGDHLDPSSPDGAMRWHCLETYEAEGKIALDLGGPMVVVHPASMLPGEKHTTDAIVAQRTPHLVDLMRRLADVGERLGVTYLIENLPAFFHLGSDAAALSRLVLDVGSSRLAMCFDTGHAHMTGDVCESLRAAAPAIRYIHINDNDGTDDDHKMPGDGTIDWDAFARTVRELDLHVPMMLEVFMSEADVEMRISQGLAADLARILALDGE